MANLTSNPIYSRSDGVISTEVDGSVVLLSTKNWAYYEFDSVGTAIWALLSEVRDLPSLVRELMQKFDVDEAQCLADTTSFLNQMMSEGIVIEAARA